MSTQPSDVVWFDGDTQADPRLQPPSDPPAPGSGRLVWFADYGTELLETAEGFLWSEEVEDYMGFRAPGDRT